MSETTSTAIEAMATAANEAPQEAVTAAVQQSHACPAPADPLEQRMAQIESTVAAFAPMIRMMQDVVGAAVPGAAPIVSRIENLETWAAQLVAHFQHKVPSPGT